MKGVLGTKFFIGDDPITTVSDQPVKSLGRWYDASLKDKDQVQQLHKDISSGLQAIDKTQLPGKLKTWCLQFGLLARVMWPLAVYEVPISTVEKLERGVTGYIRKWLGVLWCLTTISLYGDGVLKLPLASLTEEFKCAKTRLQMTLSKSRDLAVSTNMPTLATGCKWTPAKAVEEATTVLRHADIVGHVQQGWGGLVGPPLSRIMVIWTTVHNYTREILTPYLNWFSHSYPPTTETDWSTETLSFQ